MIIKHIAIAAACLVAGCKDKDKDKTNEQPAAAAPAAPAAPAKVTAPSAVLAAAIAAANACKPDDDCPARDALYDAAAALGPDVYRGAIKLATSHETRRALTEGVAKQLDESLLVELMHASEACTPDQECQAADDFSVAVGDLTPVLFRAGMTAAKTPDSRRELIESIRSHMDPSLIPDIAPYIGDEEIGRAAQQALAMKEDTAALAQLATLLDRHDRTDTIHSQVPDLLAKYPNNPSVKAAVPKLREMAKKDHQGWGKASAAVAVAKIEREAAIPFLVDFVTTETWGPGRAAATEQLGTFKTNAVALATLKKLGKDADKDVSAAATKAMQ